MPITFDWMAVRKLKIIEEVEVGRKFGCTVVVESDRRDAKARFPASCLVHPTPRRSFSRGRRALLVVDQARGEADN